MEILEEIRQRELRELKAAEPEFERLILASRPGFMHTVGFWTDYLRQTGVGLFLQHVRSERRYAFVRRLLCRLVRKGKLDTCIGCGRGKKEARVFGPFEQKS